MSRIQTIPAVYPFENGPLADFFDEWPSALEAWNGGRLELGDSATHFGFVHEHPALLVAGAGAFELQPGMYFSLNGPGFVEGAGRSLVMSRLGYCGFFQVGGPIGVIFAIPAETEHSFRTRHHALTVIAYHPDSDFGPTDGNHPMINRTVVPETHLAPGAAGG